MSDERDQPGNSGGVDQQGVKVMEEREREKNKES
jgi:hypothetical protein